MARMTRNWEKNGSDPIRVIRAIRGYPGNVYHVATRR